MNKLLEEEKNTGGGRPGKGYTETWKDTGKLVHAAARGGGRKRAPKIMVAKGPDI